MLPPPVGVPSLPTAVTPPRAVPIMQSDGTRPSDDAEVAPSAPAELEIRPLWQVERDLINAALRVSDGNISKAATMLELSPSTIYRRLREAEAREEQTG